VPQADLLRPTASHYHQLRPSAHDLYTGACGRLSEAYGNQRKVTETSGRLRAPVHLTWPT